MEYKNMVIRFCTLYLKRLFWFTYLFMLSILTKRDPQILTKKKRPPDYIEDFRPMAVIQIDRSPFSSPLY